MVYEQGGVSPAANHHHQHHLYSQHFPSTSGRARRRAGKLKMIARISELEAQVALMKHVIISQQEELDADLPALPVFAKDFSGAILTQADHASPVQFDANFTTKDFNDASALAHAQGSSSESCTASHATPVH
eukprot:5427024-Karenia_brevis.AAC.1